MLSTRLIQMIEAHAEQLTQGLVQQLKSHPRTASYKRFSDTEIHNRTYTVYKNLGAWTVGKSEGEIRRTYKELGLDRFEECIPTARGDLRTDHHQEAPAELRAHPRAGRHGTGDLRRTGAGQPGQPVL